MPELAPRLALLILVTAAALGMLFAVVVFGAVPGLGLTLFVWAIIAVVVGLALYDGRHFRFDIIALLLLIAFFSAMIAVRANPLLIVLNILGCALLGVLASHVLSRKPLLTFLPIDYVRLAFPLPYLKSVGTVVSRSVATISTSADSQKTLAITKGVVVTLPVLVVFALLFSSADPIFGDFLRSIFNIPLAEDMVMRIAFATAAALVLAALGGYAFRRQDGESHATSRNRMIGGIESGILLGSINALFFLFLLFQLSYLFGGAENVVHGNFTYAELARRGFFELMAVSAFTYLILLAAELYIEKSTTVHTRQFKILSSFMILQVSMLMISSFVKLSLYEEMYGFTTLRLYSHAFILLLGVFFASLLYKIHWDHRDETFAFRTFVSVVVFLAVMNLFNPDAFIARMNLARYETGKVDIEHLAALSDDAVPTIVGALRSVPSDKRPVLVGMLSQRTQRSAIDRKDWRSWTFSSMLANNSLGAI